MSVPNHLKRQLIRYKDQLANLTRRNREIYYKESKASTINLSKQPFQRNMFAEGVEVKFSPLRSMNEDFNQFLKSPEFNINEHFQLDDLRDREALNRMSNRLDKIRLADDRHQREYGISGAWVLGPFLCWKSSPQATRDDLLISPVFKIPIDLKRNKRRKMVLTAEDAMLSFNPSLLLALKQFLGVSVPDGTLFETVREGLNFLIEQLAIVKKSVQFPEKQPEAIPKIPSKMKILKDENGNETRIPIKLEDVLTQWELEIYDRVSATEFMLLDVLYLDQLNASRMVLFNDYDGILETDLDHPIFNELFNGIPLSDTSTSDRSKLRELDSYKERENHFVVDIDGTQHRAIDRAIKSKAIVIQGPPGTGKSQTIVNLIADYLAKGKKILFVSEKRPALDVVFNRMRSANIESQAVLIHSSDLNKADLYQNFLEMANSKPNSADEKEWETAASGLDRLKKDINQYADVLQTVHDSSELIFADLLVFAVNKRRELFDPKIFSLFSKLNFENLQSLANELNDIQSLLIQYPSLPSSPWISRLQTTVSSVSLDYALKNVCEDLRRCIQEENRLKLKYKDMTDCEYEPSVSSLWSSMRAPDPIDSNYAPLWKNCDPSLKEGLHQIKVLLNSELLVLEKNRSYFESIDSTIAVNLVEELENYYRLPRGFADWFSGPFWSYRKIRLQICPKWDGTNRQFTGYRLYRESFNKIIEANTKVTPAVDLKVESHEKNILIIRERLTIIDRLISSLQSLEKALPSKLLKMVMDSVSSFNDAIKLIGNVKECSEEICKIQNTLQPNLNELSKYLIQIPTIKSLTDAELFTATLIEKITELDALDKFDILVSRIAERYNIPTLRSIILSHFTNKSDKWSEILESSCILGWVDEIHSSSPLLRSFDRNRITDQIQELKVALDRHQLSSRQAVHQAFAKRWNLSPRNEEAVGLLKKESTKQRRILSPREVMEKGALKTMLDLKPCWLMSPLSISQILPLKSCLFDVIIFDEASQVRVEDAIPSIYRAGTMIVVGDPKQMPPTNFFSGGVIEDDEDEEEISPSVLDLAAQIYPSVLLEWHYRSRSEALIAFSNRAYYGGRLIAAPNPQVLTATKALHFRQIQNAYFEGKDGNCVEAEAVIDHLVNLIREKSNRSFGVIAMGQVQANALDEALSRRIADNEEVRTLIEKAMSLKDGEADVGLFIKNLENVQGDERDVILISVGYAAAASDKKLRMNFGPLGKQGGGRRLNVAITRAKSEIYVFASFAPAEMKTDEEAFGRNPDLCVFGRYLKYVEAVSTGRLDVAHAILNSFPMGGAMTYRKSSRFALDVKRRLEDLGYQVTAEIGTSGFFIDLGIHHPTIQSNFILGIECDGAVFHSTPYARDRDKIREQLLVARGWKIERVWSQDWSRDWRKEIIRLEGKIKMLLGSDHEIMKMGKASSE